MGRYWWLNCPYCNSEIASGWGYRDKFPDVFFPLIRCQYCGKLFKTGGSEYLTMSPIERFRLKNNKKNCEYIEQSLDRTNNIEYLKFLNERFVIYPVTNEDKFRFSDVDFEKYRNKMPSDYATQSLYDFGVLINDEQKDPDTGGLKKEILEKNQLYYSANKKAIAWGGVVGLIVGLISFIGLGTINPHGYLCLLGIIIGLAASFVTFLVLWSFYTHSASSLNSNDSAPIVKESTMQRKVNESDQEIETITKLYINGILTEEEYNAKIRQIKEKK